MKIGIVMSAWIEIDGKNVPALRVDHDVLKCANITGQRIYIPEPNQTIFAVACDDAVAAAIESDPDYTVLTDDGVTDGVFFDYSGDAESTWFGEIEEWLDG